MTTKPMSLAELRKQRGQSLEQLSKQVSEMNKKGGGDDKEADERFWQCKVDDAGNGSAVIRFLSACKTETAPFVRLFSHGFKGPTGKWYIENSLTTLKQKDPVQELNNALWATNDKDKIEIARKQKRKVAYYANVYVVKDPANPENEGKVKIFRFNKTIMDMIEAQMKDEEVDDDLKDEGIEPRKGYNPFDFWDGANFSLKIKQKDKYANFDDSKFLKQKPLSEDDDVLEAIWDKCHPLQWIVAEDQFKSYEDLEKRLHTVLGVSGGKTSKPKDDSDDDMDDEDKEFIQQRAKSTSKPKPAPKDDDDEEEEEKAPPKAKAKPAAKIDKEDLPDAGGDGDGDDPDLDYFRKLAEG